MCTKINIFLIVTIAFFFLSCEKEDNQVNPIPDIRVNISINILTTPELQSALQPKYIGSANGQKVGYKGHGIYVTKINSNEFRAFDASCTLLSNDSNHSEIEEHLIQENNKLIVYCPKCKSKFNLLDGNVQSGPAKEGLSEYRTAYSGNNLRIYN
ncbi:Rieske (2Fe-2S) protein [Balneicella halophila]|uniref:hypothetical protein n=1 Tax=Balneicella halophila TaxID=1537566 RepID=UPI001057A9F0|nr:hypothetical protein [Balneicella halophila]